MQLVETWTYWAAVLGYSSGFAMFVLALVYLRPKYSRRAAILTTFGLTLHTVALLLRWLQTGYPPFVEFFESVSASAWFGILIYLSLQSLRPRFRSAGVLVTGIAVLLLGWAGAPDQSGGVLSASLQSAWLFVHASFATAGVGCFIAGAGSSAVWLWRRRAMNGTGTPETGEIDDVVFRLLLTGFLFYTIMILSGSIWAEQAWGRYWAWDPIETWSLITWLVYALYLHLHFAYPSLRGRVLIWYAICAVLLAAFSLWGVGFVYDTIHTYG